MSLTVSLSLVPLCGVGQRHPPPRGVGGFTDTRLSSGPGTERQCCVPTLQMRKPRLREGLCALWSHSE